MRNCLVCLVLLFFSLLCFSPACAWTAYVVRVEGGGIVVVSEKRDSDENPVVLSFYGVEVPTLQQPFGPEALEYLRLLLPVGSKVNVESANRDDEGTSRALIQIDGKSVNYQLLVEGLAWVNRAACKAIFCRRWHIQEHRAIEEKLGLWSLPMSTPPWQWSR
jgi:endonuclease YncB( thermonuclease family)